MQSGEGGGKSNTAKNPFASNTVSVPVSGKVELKLKTLYLSFLSGLNFLGGSDSKASACNAETCVRSLGQEDPLEKEMATHSSTLAWKIPWTEERGTLQSMESQRARHDFTFTFLVVSMVVFRAQHLKWWWVRTQLPSA